MNVRVYSLGNLGLVSSQVAAAIGLPSHILQVEVIVAAETKQKAHAALVAAKIRGVSMRSPEFTIDDSLIQNDLWDADMFEELPVVYAYPPTAGPVGAVVRVKPGGAPEVVGRIEFGPHRRGFVRL